MEHMTVGQIVNACKGTLLLGEPDIVVKHISLNSRTMKGNDLFVPLIENMWMPINTLGRRWKMVQ